MLLDRVVASAASCPPALLEVVARRALAPGCPARAQVVGVLVAHPNLPLECVPSSRVSVGVLVAAARSPLITPARFAALFAVAAPGVQRHYVAVDPDAPGVCLEMVAAVDRLRCGHLSRRVARLLALHPGTPVAVHVQALGVLARVGAHRAGDVPLLRAAVLRHPDRLVELAGEFRDRRVGVGLAGGDSFAGHVRDALAGGSSELDWAGVVAGLGVDDRVGVLAVAGGAGRGLAWVLASVRVRVPRRCKVAVLRAWLVARGGVMRLRGDLVVAVPRLVKVAGSEVLGEVAAAATSWWELPDPCELGFDASGQSLDALWCAAGHLYEKWRPVRVLAEYGFALAMQPAASVALRREVAQVIVSFGASSAADRRGTFSPGRALQILDDIDRCGFTGAGLRLGVQEFRLRTFGRSMALELALAPLGRAAVDVCALVLSDRRVARGFDVLTDSFCGTLGELSCAVAAVTG